MKATTTPYLLALFGVLLAISIQSADGHAKCKVGCLMGMMTCARKAAVIAENFEEVGCCDVYFSCMKRCGEETASCGTRQMQTEKRGSWNKRFDYDDFRDNDLPYRMSRK